MLTMIMKMIIMMIISADHGPLTVMVRTDEGVRYWGSGELVGPAPDLNTTQVRSSSQNSFCNILIRVKRM